LDQGHHSLVIDSAMFSYPPTLLIHAGDNLVSDGQGFASAMNSGAGVGTRVEKREFLLAAMLWLEFLTFDGNGDPLQWIHRCECYFRDCRTPENKRVTYAAFHLLDDTQLWYHRLPGGPPTWEHFVLLIVACFMLQITLGGDYRQIANGDIVRAAEGDALDVRRTNALADRGSMSVGGAFGIGDFGVVDGVSVGISGLSGVDIKSVGNVFTGDAGGNNNVPGDGGATVVGIVHGAGVPGSGSRGTCGYESASTSVKIKCAPQPTNWIGSELAQSKQLSLARSASNGSLQLVCLGPPPPARFGLLSLKQCAGQTLSTSNGNSFVVGWGGTPSTDDDVDLGSDRGIRLGRCGGLKGFPGTGLVAF
jgi:hypothetical protein